MRLIPLQSSQIIGLAFSPEGDDKGKLYVQFNNGNWYVYDDVPALKVMQVILAESQGTAFDRLIKRGNYAYKRLDGEPEEDIHI